MKSRLLISAICLSSLVAVIPANGASFTFSTGNPDGLMAAASRPMSAGKFEVETADDFVLTNPTSITSATFTGLIRTPLKYHKRYGRNLPDLPFGLGCHAHAKCANPSEFAV